VHREGGMSDEAKACTWCNGTGRRVVRHAGTGEKHGMNCACQITDLPIGFVYQEEESGCGIAAVAMATRQSYRDVRRLLSMAKDLSDERFGVDVEQIDNLLDALGFAWQTRYLNEARLAMQRDPWPCAPWADVHLCHVRSLSDAGHHYVVMIRDGRVLDPWWGVIQGLHRYPSVHSIKAVYRVDPVVAATPEAV
jgi:hypothetical protein